MSNEARFLTHVAAIHHRMAEARRFADDGGPLAGVLAAYELHSAQRLEEELSEGEAQVLARLCSDNQAMADAAYSLGESLSQGDGDHLPGLREAWDAAQRELVVGE